MALQLALTTLESLAEMLNERKRECEQVAAFTEKLHTLGGKIGPRDSREARPGQARMLLREDDVQRLEFNPAGQVGIMLYCVLIIITTMITMLTLHPGGPHQDPAAAAAERPRGVRGGGGAAQRAGVRGPARRHPARARPARARAAQPQVERPRVRGQ